MLHHFLAHMRPLSSLSSSLLLLHSNPELSCSSRPFHTCPACAPPTLPPETLPGSLQTAAAAVVVVEVVMEVEVEVEVVLARLWSGDIICRLLWCLFPEKRHGGKFQSGLLSASRCHTSFSLLWEKQGRNIQEACQRMPTNILQPYCCCTIKKPRVVFNTSASFAFQSTNFFCKTCRVYNHM